MLRSADKLIAPDVEQTLEALGLGQVDAGAVKLARFYAAAIDLADLLAAEADRLAAEIEPGDLATRAQLAALAAKVQRQAVLGNLGPKLLATLQALQATPAARAKRRGGGEGDRASPSRLEALRQTRRA